MNFKAPNRKCLQQAAEQKDPRPGKNIEKSFDLVRRGHLFRVAFYGAGIACVLDKLIKIAQMTTGTVGHKAQNLFEKLEDIESFTAFSDGTKKSFQQWKNPNTMHIGNKQGQTGPACQAFAGFFYCADFQFLFSVIFAIFAHRALHLVGFCSRCIFDLLLIIIPVSYPKVKDFLF
jgi:hypothetical protein